MTMSERVRFFMYVTVITNIVPLATNKITTVTSVQLQQLPDNLLLI